jgi:ribonuclease R
LARKKQDRKRRDDDRKSDSSRSSGGKPSGGKPTGNNKAGGKRSGGKHADGGGDARTRRRPAPHVVEERPRGVAKRPRALDPAALGPELPPDALAAAARCRLSLHPQGFGFAEREDGEGTIFIPAQHRAGAMDGDEVLVAHWPADRGREGAVRSIVARRRTRLTGVVRRTHGRITLEPEDPRVVDGVEVVGELPGDALGKVALADIVEYPAPGRGTMLVTLDRVLGPPGRIATEMIKILIEHGVDPEFPPNVLEAAESVPTAVVPADLENRRDLRALPFMTIDPPDARDFDDAVCVEAGPGGDVRLHVAVADVSHYVREGDPFDAEAALRCFSCYLPDRAVPMLPVQLSSNICSLVPNEDRLAMVVTMDIDERGNVNDADVCAAVIRSRARLSYEQAADMLAHAKGKEDERARVIELRAVADRLRKVRLRRGAIELNLPEVKVKLDQDDAERVRSVEHARAKPEIARAYNLIEELMLAANEAVARIGVRARLPLLYRVHASPDEARVERFCAIAGLLGIDVDVDVLQTPKAMQTFLKRIAKHPRSGALHGLLLRALAQAEYATANVGHFALASGAYLHFTSPIRRYADLVDHRVLKAHLRRTDGMSGPDPVPSMPARHVAQAIAHRASERERQVAQAERDAKQMLCAVFMRDRIGDRFEGVVTGMSNAGAYVALDEPPVDGIVRRSALEREARETFAVDELMARMTGDRSGTTIAIGDRVLVELVDASIARRQIELALIRRLVD